MAASGSNSTRIVVVDDSEVVRLKLRTLFATSAGAEGFELVGEAEDGETAVKLIREHQPDVAVMDLRMPGMSGIEATWQLGTVSPSTRVLVLTVSDEQTDIADAIMAGAKGYVVKGASDDEIIEAIRAVARGEQAISSQVAAELVDRTRPWEATPAQAMAGVPAASALRTVFSRDNLAQTLLIAILVGALLTMTARGDEFMQGDATGEDWALGAVNIFVSFLLINVGLLAGRAGVLRR